MELQESTFRFSDPWLKKLIFQENPLFNIEKEFQGFEGVSATVKCGDFGDKSEAEVSLSVEIGNLAINDPFSIVIEMAANFSWENEIIISPKDLLERNAPILLLSYIRPIVANITSNSKYPTFHLPFMNFNDSEIQ